MSENPSRPSFSMRAANLLSEKVPPTLLLGLIRVLQDRGKIGRRLVKIFDPNHLRRHFKRPPRARNLEVSGPDWALTVDVNDHIGYRMFITQLPFERSLELLNDALGESERNVILDIGANIGSASIPVCAKNHLRLIAVEASKKTARLLQQNVSRNDIDAQVFQVAIIDEDHGEHVTLKVNLGNEGANSIHPSWNPGVEENDLSESVPSVTLDRLSGFFTTTEIKLVKIDVEGAEELVFRGGRNFLDVNDAPIVFEYRLDGASRYLGHNLDNVVTLLSEAGYKIFALQTSPIRLSSFVPHISYENVVALKPHTDAWMRLLPIISAGDDK